MKEKDDRKSLRWLFRFILPIMLLLVALDHGGMNAFTKELATISLWGFAFIVLLELKEIRVPSLRTAIPWLAFWIWGIITILTSWSPDGTFTWALQFGGFIALAIIVFALADEPHWLFFRNLFIGATIIILIGFFFIIGAKTDIFIGRHDMMLHFISTFYWKNPAAGYLILLLPISFALSFGDPRRGWRIFYFIFTILCGAAILLTRSRGAWLAFAAAILVGAFFCLFTIKKI